MDIGWDKAKARANELKHGVSFADASDVLNDPMSIVLEDNSHREQRFQAIGGDGGGRVLAVIFTYRGDRYRIISARKAVKWERQLYEE
ncbi:MAG: BrnT family toxin [Magnetococcales bacterium]|nr:BrnT family toxin [Magnetococcales bacterium]MBF0323311.1 BrnT family toxin [Magnetococcales bacterium]